MFRIWHPQLNPTEPNPALIKTRGMSSFISKEKGVREKR